MLFFSWAENVAFISLGFYPWQWNRSTRIDHLKAVCYRPTCNLPIPPTPPTPTHPKSKWVGETNQLSCIHWLFVRTVCGPSFQEREREILKNMFIVKARERLHKYFDRTQVWSLPGLVDNSLTTDWLADWLNFQWELTAQAATIGHMLELLLEVSLFIAFWSGLGSYFGKIT